MRQVAKKGLLTAVATGGVLAVTTGGLAYADSNAQGVAAGSPGVLSGNTVQVPVHVPINACGNTINIVGALNPATGNTCVNASGGHKDAHGSSRGSSHGSDHGTGHGSDHGWSHGSGHGWSHGSGHGSDHGWSHGSGSGDGSGHDGSHHHGGGSSAEAIAKGSPGVVSGNVVQVPVDVPVNACGNSVNVIAAVNPALGNTCANVEGSGHHAHHPGHGTKGPQHPGHPGHPGQPHHPGKPSGHQPAKPHHPAKPHQPGHANHPGKPTGQQPMKPTGPQLAHTGSENLGLTLVTGAGMLLGGAVLFRRSRKVRA